MRASERLRKLVLSLCAMVAATAVPLLGQEVYIASWTMQDLDYDLQQTLAVDIIERANEWLTRDNPEAPTARLDDRLRVTIVGEYNSSDGTLRERLLRLNLGGLLLEEEFNEFLDSTLIRQILLRSYYWRDEALTVLDPSLSPEYYRMGRQPVRPNAPPSYDKAFGTTANANKGESLNSITIPLTDRARIWAGVGYEEMGFPGLSYRRLRFGMESGGVRTWFEAPLPIAAGEIISGANQASPGAGLSFELGRFGGGVTWSDPYSVSGLEGDSGYVMNTSALLYGIIPIDYILSSPFNGWLRVKLGAGYLQGMRLLKDSTGSIEPTESFEYPRVFVRGEYVSVRRDGTEERSASLGVFGTSIVASFNQRFGDLFGIGVSGAIHGVGDERPPFLPQYSVWLTPVLFLK